VSLRGRLSLVFALGTAALIVICGLAFLGQLRSPLNSALDESLRTRGDALAAQLHAGACPPVAHRTTGQTGQQNGQFSGADEFAQVLTPVAPSATRPGWSRHRPFCPERSWPRPRMGGSPASTVVEGEQVRVMAAETRWRGRPVIVVTGATTDVANAAQARARLILLIGGPLAVVAAGLGAWLLTGAALRPVDQMRRRLDEITEHDGETRLPVPPTKDEIASLAVTTNRLLDRLQQALTRSAGSSPTQATNCGRR